MKKELKNILVLFGSPHKNGYTSLLLNHFLEFFPETNIKIVNAYEKNIKPCIDCKICKTSEKCFFDDMNSIHNYLEICDIIIIATPIYNSSFPAPLKSILDRTQRYYNAKHYLKVNPPLKKNKKTVLLLTQGSCNKIIEKNIMVQIQPSLSLLNSSETYCLTLKNTDKESLRVDKFYIKSENIIRNIIHNLYERL